MCHSKVAVTVRYLLYGALYIYIARDNVETK